MKNIAFILHRLTPLIIFILLTRGCADMVIHAMGDEPEESVENYQMTVDSYNETQVIKENDYIMSDDSKHKELETYNQNFSSEEVSNDYIVSDEVEPSLTPTDEDEYMVADIVPGVSSPSTVNRQLSTGTQIAREALGLLGFPYVSGGVSPKEGFDCSGLAFYIYKKYGIDIPRLAYDQYYGGKAVDSDNIEKGDLVFFQVYGSDNSFMPAFVKNKLTEYVKVMPTHIGIYIGKGKFVHSPKPGGTVKIATFENKFWKSHFMGAKRYVSREYMAKDIETK